MTSMDSDKNYSQFETSIRSIFELTTRVDERVQSIMKKQEELETKIDNQLIQMNSLNTRVSILESKNNTDLIQNVKELKSEIHTLEKRLLSVESISTESKDNWKNVFNIVLQAIQSILVAYLIYKLGISPGL